MAGYVGTKAVLLSTTAANVGGDADIGGALDVGGAFTSQGIDDNATSTAMTLDASGNIGIGRAPTSTYKLDFYGELSGNWLAHIHNSHATNGYGVKIRAGDDNNVSAFRVSSQNNATTILDCTGGGIVTKPNQPHFQAACPTTPGTYTMTSDTDTLSEHMTVAARNIGSHYNTSTGIFTAPVAGNYLFTGAVRWETGNFTQNSYIRVFISKNNGDWNSGYGAQIAGNNEGYANYTPMSVSSVIYLAANDNVRLKGGMHNGNASMFRESYFTGMLIG